MGFSLSVFAKIKSREVRFGQEKYQVLETYSKDHKKIQGQIILGDDFSQELYDHNLDGVIDEKVLEKGPLKIHYRNALSKGMFLNLDISKRTKKGFAILEYYYNFKAKGYRLFSKRIEPYKVFYADDEESKIAEGCSEGNSLEVWLKKFNGLEEKAILELVRDKLISSSCDENQFAKYKEHIAQGITQVMVSLGNIKESCFEKIGLTNVDLKLQAELIKILEREDAPFKCNLSKNKNEQASFHQEDNKIYFHQVPNSNENKNKKDFFAKLFYHEVLHQIGADEDFVDLTEKCCINIKLNEEPCNELKNNSFEKLLLEERSQAIFANLIGLDSSFPNFNKNTDQRKLYRRVVSDIVERYKNSDVNFLNKETVNKICIEGAYRKICKDESKFSEKLKKSLETLKGKCDDNVDKCKRAMEVMVGVGSGEASSVHIPNAKGDGDMEEETKAKISEIEATVTGDMAKDRTINLNLATNQRTVSLTSGQIRGQAARLELSNIRRSSSSALEKAGKLIKNAFLPEAKAATLDESPNDKSVHRRSVASRDDKDERLEVKEEDYVLVQGEASEGDKAMYKAAQETSTESTNQPTSVTINQVVVLNNTPNKVKGKVDKVPETSPVNEVPKSLPTNLATNSPASLPTNLQGPPPVDEVSENLPTKLPTKNTFVSSSWQTPPYHPSNTYQPRDKNNGRESVAVQWKERILNNPRTVVDEIKKDATNTQFNEQLISQGIRIGYKEKFFGASAQDYQVFYKYNNNQFIEQK